jgi:hypothetical protein
VRRNDSLNKCDAKRFVPEINLQSKTQQTMNAKVTATGDGGFPFASRRRICESPEKRSLLYQFSVKLALGTILAFLVATAGQKGKKEKGVNP